MTLSGFHPTPYPEVNAVLKLLLSGVQAILRDRFVGMYLYGSLASGDFEPHRSDVDLIVVTNGVLPGGMLPALKAMHARLHSSGMKWATKLEGAYISQHALRCYDPNEAPCPYFNEGSFRVGRLGSDWVIQRHILREQGAVVAGPPIQAMIDPVHPGDLRRAVLDVLQGWWAPMLQNPSRLRTCDYQAYAVLTMCRALYTLQHGTIISKQAAARWGLEKLGEHWAGLIEWALAWRGEALPDRLDETLDFIQYTLESSVNL